MECPSKSEIFKKLALGAMFNKAAWKVIKITLFYHKMLHIKTINFTQKYFLSC